MNEPPQSNPGPLRNDRSPRQHVGTIICLAGITGLGLWLRWTDLDDSFWVDELHTSWATAGDFSDVAPRAQLGNNSPLFFWLLWALQTMLGNSEAVLRCISFVSGVLLIPGCFYVAVHWFHCRVAGLLAAMLAACDPHLLFFSVEARPYGLIQFLAVIHVFLLTLLMHRSNAGRRTGFVLIGILLFYLHYTASLLLVAELAALLLNRKRNGYAFREVRLDFGVMFATMSLSLPHIFQISERRELWAAFIGASPPLIGSWHRVGAVTIFPLPAYLLPVLLSWLMIVVARGMLALRSPTNTLAPRRGDRPINSGTAVSPSIWIGIICWLVVPILLAWSMTRLDGWESIHLARLFFRRYLVVVTCAPILLSAATVALMPTRPARIFVALAVVITSSVWVGPGVEYRSRGRWINRGNEDWRTAIAWLNSQRTDPDVPVLVYAGLIEVDQFMQHSPMSQIKREYCVLPLLGRYRVEGGLFPISSRAEHWWTPAVSQKIRDSQEVWFVIRGSSERAEQIRETVSALDELRDFQLNAKRQFASRVHLAHYERRHGK